MTIFSDNTTPSILIIDDKKTERVRIAGILKDAGLNVVSKSSTQVIHPGAKNDKPPKTVICHGHKDIHHALENMPSENTFATIILMPSVSALQRGTIHAKKLQKQIAATSEYSSIAKKDTVVYFWTKEHPVDEIIAEIIDKHAPKTAEVVELNAQQQTADSNIVQAQTA